LELKIDYNPKGDKIVFDDKWHSYTLENRHKCTSGTKFVHMFFPEFERDKIAAMTAKKRGVSVATIIAEWEYERDISCDLGNNTHLYSENLMLGKELPKPKTPKQKLYFKNADAFIQKLLKRYDIVELEKIVFSYDNEVAGMVDLVLKNKRTGRIHIDDWKTNKKIDMYSRYNRRALYPIQHMDDCNYVHYILQLSLYKYLMHSEGYYAEDEIADVGRIYFINPKGVEIIKTPYAETEIKRMFKKFKGGR